MPFEMYEKEIGARLNLRVLNIPTDTPQDRTAAIDKAIGDGLNPTHIMVIPHWSESAQDLSGWFDRTRIQLNQLECAESKLVLLDTSDPTCSPHFPVLEHVDVLIKGKILVDREKYNTPYRSGFLYADFVADTWGFDLEDWFFGSIPPQEHAHKLVQGWNLGITPRYVKMLDWTSRVKVPWGLRRIDLHQRTGGLGQPGKKQEWYQFSRTKALEALKPLESRYRLTSTSRVSVKKYLMELCLSKAVFSPFGWGEVCFRDYEAIACGALLVKPDMSHLVTEPNIYIPHETYVPIAWDYSDAADQIDEYLSDPAKSKKIIKNAREALREYYRSAHFVDTLGKCLFDQHEQESN